MHILWLREGKDGEYVDIALLRDVGSRLDPSTRRVDRFGPPPFVSNWSMLTQRGLF